MMPERKSEWRKLLWGVAVFAACFALPIEWPRFNKAIFEPLALVKWYAQEHVLLCLVPAFFIAGAMLVRARPLLCQPGDRAFDEWGPHLRDYQLSETFEGEAS